MEVLAKDSDESDKGIEQTEPTTTITEAEPTTIEQPEPSITITEETTEREKEEDEEDLESSVKKELDLSQKIEFLSVFQDNMRSGRSILKHFVQARLSRNRISKGVNPDVAVRYLTKKKAANLSGIDKARTWVASDYQELPTYSASSSGTLGSGRLFTDFQTLLIQEAIW